MLHRRVWSVCTATAGTKRCVLITFKHIETAKSNGWKRWKNSRGKKLSHGSNSARAIILQHSPTYIWDLLSLPTTHQTVESSLISLNKAGYKGEIEKYVSSQAEERPWSISKLPAQEKPVNYEFYLLSLLFTGKIFKGRYYNTRCSTLLITNYPYLNSQINNQGTWKLYRLLHYQRVQEFFEWTGVISEGCMSRLSVQTWCCLNSSTRFTIVISYFQISGY